MGTTMECITAIVLLVVNLRLSRPRAEKPVSEDALVPETPEAK